MKFNIIDPVDWTWIVDEVNNKNVRMLVTAGKEYYIFCCKTPEIARAIVKDHNDRLDLINFRKKECSTCHSINITDNKRVPYTCNKCMKENEHE